MPFVSGALLSLLAKNRRYEDVVIPADGYGLQHLHAVYARDALPKLERALEAKTLSLSEVLNGLRTRVVKADEWAEADPSGRFAFNINTEHDLDLM
jgi:molybdopterin-guanine dinucleotide biosynthesis protein A